MKKDPEEEKRELAHISHKILDEDGQDVTTDCSDSPRDCEKSGLDLVNFMAVWMPWIAVLGSLIATSFMILYVLFFRSS